MIHDVFECGDGIIVSGDGTGDLTMCTETDGDVGKLDFVGWVALNGGVVLRIGGNNLLDDDAVVVADDIDDDGGVVVDVKEKSNTSFKTFTVDLSSSVVPIFPVGKGILASSTDVGVGGTEGGRINFDADKS